MHWKCDLAGQVSAMLHMLQMGPSKVFTTSHSEFRALGSSHSWSFPPCRNTVTSPSSDSSDMYTSTVQSSPASANAALSPHPRLQTSYPPSAHYVSSPSATPPPSLAPGFSSASPDSLRVLQWNAGGLQARSNKLLHILSSHPVDLICIQESNLNSSFRIPGFSALRSDRTHSRSGILSSDTTHASGDVVIFVRQGLSFSELSTPTFSSLDPYSDCVGVNISLNKSSSVSFPNVCAPLIRASPTDGRTNSLSPSILPSSRHLFILGDYNCHHPLWDSRGTSEPRGEEVFHWVISSDLPLNDPDTPTLLHRSSGSRSSPDISFAPSTFAFFCSCKMLQDLGCDHLPILLSIPLSPVFRPNARPPSFNFQKARWDSFASYFDSHCSSAEEYSSLSLSSAAALFTSLALNAAKSSIPFGRIKRPALRSRARDYLTELRRATCPMESHSSFCSPFTLAEFLAAASNLSSSIATGPDKVAYPMLKHLPRSGMDFVLHIFNFSLSSHSPPSAWKASSIIPIHKVGKPFDSPASFRPISLASCVSKLFERIILSRLLFFLQSNSILSPRQAGFRPVRSTLDQILYLSQSISDGFNKPRPGCRTILSTIDFSKAFDSVWHSALFHKLISAGLPPCFARWTQSFLSDRHASVVYQNHKNHSFRVRRGVPRSWPCTFLSLH